MQGDDAWRLQLLIDSVLDYAIYMVDRDGRVATWNSGAARLEGYRSEEIIGQSFAKFFTPEDQARGLPEMALATAARTGRFKSEGWRVRRDGTQFWALAVIEAVRDRDGQLIGSAEVARDMTEQRLEQQRLLESESRFRHLVHAVIDYAIFQLDKDGAVVTWNAGAERIKGYTADEIMVITSVGSTRRKTSWREFRSGRSQSQARKEGSKLRDGGCARTERASGPRSSSMRSAATPATSWGLLRLRAT
jgi:PAS domain S-box-containing protein